MRNILLESIYIVRLSPLTLLMNAIIAKYAAINIDNMDGEIREFDITS